jgi:Tfp pilus assembly protein PilN
MTSDNPVADRLVNDARKKTARQESPTLAKAALIVGVVAVLASPVSIAGWILGAVTLALGVPSMQRSVSIKQAKIAVLLGVAAILIGVFFFTWNIAQR